MSEKTTPEVPKLRITQLEVRHMQQEILRILAKGPQNTSYFTERFNLSKWAMSKYMKRLANKQKIHSVRLRGRGAANPFQWHLGPGEHAVEADDGLASYSSGVKQRCVTTWPPCRFAKQHIWSAVMD